MGAVWFYCENCFQTEMKDLSQFKKAVESLEGFKWNKEGMFSYLNGLICPHCGCHHSTFSIDFFMIPVVRGLNEKGYITRACCSGHKEATCFHSEGDNAYVLIEHSDTLRNYLKKHGLISFECFSPYIDLSLELGEEDGIDDRGICIRARFKDDISEENKQLNNLSFAIFAAISDFPDNEDDNKLIKYSYCHGDGTPYKDKKGD